MKIEMEEWKDWADCAQRELEHKLERMREEKEKVDNYLMAIEVARRLTSENEKQAAEIETLRQQLQEEKRLRAELEMKMNERSKLSAGMAKKASEEDLSKALRIYLNTSKRKTQSKREAAKTVFMEMLMSAKLELPDDIMELLEHLDDEQADNATIVNVEAGGINIQQAKNVKK